MSRISKLMKSDKLFFDSIWYQYDMRVFFSIQYDTIRYEGLKEDLLFEEFSANFQNFRRIFGIFGAVVVVVDDFGSWVFWINGEFSEFSENFWNFRRKKTKKSLVLKISRYSIWEVRYNILSDILKSPKYRHSIISQYDNLGPDWYVIKDNPLVPLPSAAPISVCQMRKSLTLSIRVEF